MGNMYGVSRRGANMIEVGNEPSTNGSIGEVSLHHAKFALGIAFSPVKLNSLVLYHLEFTLMRSIPIDVSDNTRVFEIYDGVVDKESRGGGRMENVEVVVFDPRTVEVGRGVCLRMKGNGVLRVPLLADSYKMSVNPDLSESYILCYLVLTVLVKEDKGVLPRITVVILTPPISWVIWVVELLSELGNIGDGARCGEERNGGIICSESDWFITLNIVV